jgi:Glycoside hydrolase 97
MCVGRADRLSSYRSAVEVIGGWRERRAPDVCKSTIARCGDDGARLKEGTTLCSCETSSSPEPADAGPAYGASSPSPIATPNLPASDIVYRLGGTTEPGDWTWLRPGTSQSEWLWVDILYDVPFASGLNTVTYRHYIEFAARFGTGYVFFDAGWSRVTDPLALTPGLDVPGLIREARDKGVSVALWTSSLPMGRQMETVPDQLQRWAVAGVIGY